MFDKLIKKLKINKESMLRNGTIAVVTMFGVGALFGVKNALLAFPIALTSTVLGRQNLRVKTIQKLSKVAIIDILIVIIAYISSLNLYVGIVINFITVFLIIYTIASPYDPTFYKPFIMLYVFTQYSSILITELPMRIISIIFGILVVLICNLLISKVDDRASLRETINKSLKLLITQSNNILMGGYDKEISKSCTIIMRELAYKIYITRYRKYLTTNLGKIKFKIYLNIEYLNIYLENIANSYKAGELKEKEVNSIKEILELLLLYNNGDLKKKVIILKINQFVNEYRNKSIYLHEVSSILISIIHNISEVDSLGKNHIYSISKDWQRGDFDSFKVTFREYLNTETIRFKFAMRMATTLTLALFIGEYLGFYKVIWAIITIMSIMQPYYEDTIAKTKERVLGNIVAIILTGILINVVNIRAVTIIILIASLYLIYAYKEYYKISIFTATASLCLASLKNDINILVIYRVGYVLIGVVIVILANKFIFPYRLEDGIKHLINKIKRYNNILIEEGLKYLDNEVEVNYIRDLTIHSTLLSQKLYLRNLSCNSKVVDEFLTENNTLLIELSYKILMCYGKDKKIGQREIEDIIEKYDFVLKY